VNTEHSYFTVHSKNYRIAIVSDDGLLHYRPNRTYNDKLTTTLTAAAGHSMPSARKLASGKQQKADKPLCRV